MKITLKDGSFKEYTEGRSIIDIAGDISEGLARAACAGMVNGKVEDLRTVLTEDCELSILTARDKEGLTVVRHTTSHVLAQAMFSRRQSWQSGQALKTDSITISGTNLFPGRIWTSWKRR